VELSQCDAIKWNRYNNPGAEGCCAVFSRSVAVQRRALQASMKGADHEY